MREQTAKVKATRARVAAERAARGWRVHASATNFLWARPPRDAAAVFQTLREQNILVRYFPGPATGDHLRITIGTDPQMDAFLAALAVSA